MKNTVVRFGAYGLLLALILFLGALVFGKEADFSTQEIIGYATMIASLSFVFFGIKHFRDKENQGVVTFGKALLIGVLISAITALGIAIADFIYTAVINPNFFEEYKATMIAQGHTEPIPDYGSFFMAFLMFATVLILGFIISLISAMLLQRKP